MQGKKSSFKGSLMHKEIIDHGKRSDLKLVCANCHNLFHWIKNRSEYNPNNKSLVKWIKDYELSQRITGE
jgi:hypothetical protein